MKKVLIISFSILLYSVIIYVLFFYTKENKYFSKIVKTNPGKAELRFLKRDFRLSNMPDTWNKYP